MWVKFGKEDLPIILNNRCINFGLTQLYYINKFKRTQLHASAYLKPPSDFDLKELNILLTTP